MYVLRYSIYTVLLAVAVVTALPAMALLWFSAIFYMSAAKVAAIEIDRARLRSR